MSQVIRGGARRRGSECRHHGRTMFRRVWKVCREIVFVTKFPAPDRRRSSEVRYHFAHVFAHERVRAAVCIAPAIDWLADEVRHSAHVPEERWNQTHAMPFRT